ncbi:MAG TPA: FlgD immunoglobulin-like domain containing protein [Candidatus Eisenbacteria bacterium]|jgi:hypothetical protein|nr:FlgD immunoglobulin-like domain containing protein [Candidatus Eisenbacteria bacterium]
MTPRDRGSRLAAFFAVALCFLTLAVVPRASASVASVIPLPLDPTTCDSTTLRALGWIGACEKVTSGEVSGPEAIPEWTGPTPAYRTRIVLTVRDTTDQPCVASAHRYTHDFPMGHLPAGLHMVTAVEHDYNFAGEPTDTSEVTTSFFVAAKDSCRTAACAFLGFSDFLCDAVTVPGGQGEFKVVLHNAVPVGGVQLKIQITDDHGNPVPAGSFTPASVRTTYASPGFQTEWQADGSSVSIVLFSTTHAVIAPGREPILRVGYSVAENVPTGVYRLTFEKTMVVDPDGTEIPPCPTLRQTTGKFCVGLNEGCDLNGDGIADIRDIIRLVRCALAGDACPDTIAARADCTGDGSIDIRDVICCIRKLLQLDRQSMIEPPATGAPTRIGFRGPGSWVSSTAGRAEIEVTPATDFGAIDFDVDAASSVRITGFRLLNGSGATLEWALRDAGTARVLLLRNGATASSFRIAVDFASNEGGPTAGDLQIAEAQSVTWDAAAAPYIVTASSAPVMPVPESAPRIEGARPNPFAASTEIPFTLPSRSHVSVRLYDVTGRLVRTLLDATQPAGPGRVTWDGRDASGRSAPTGVYFVKLTTPGGERTARMIKMR